MAKRVRVSGREKLRAWMAEHGVSAAELSRRSGLGEPYISMLLSGVIAYPGARPMAQIKSATEGAITADDFLPEVESHL